MRPTILNPLFAPVTTLSGVGPKQDKLLRYLLSCSETPRLVDLLLHLPASVIDRRNRPKVRDVEAGTVPPGGAQALRFPAAQGGAESGACATGDDGHPPRESVLVAARLRRAARRAIGAGAGAGAAAPPGGQPSRRRRPSASSDHRR